MFASMRSKKKTRDSPGSSTKTDQQQQQPGRRKDGKPEALKLPSPLRYYPGTQMPMDGWFHACRLCRCWTAFSATATTGEVVPLCRRCLSTAARKGVQTAPKISSQASQKHQSSSAAAAAAAAASSVATKALPAPAAHRTGYSDAAAKVNHPWGSSYTNMHQQAQIYQQQQQQQALQHQQQRYQQQPAPGHAKSTHTHKAGSRVFKPAGSSDSTSSSFIAPSQVAAAAAAASAALAAASGAPAAPTAASTGPQAQQQQLGYSRASTSSSNGIPDRRSSTGDQYVPCYKHLGPTNMHSAAAPADAYITCLGNGSTDNGANSREQSGSDMLGAITSLLSDLYNMRFSGGSNAGSRSSSRSDSHEVLSRSNSGSGSKKGAVAAAAADSLRNLPI